MERICKLCLNEAQLLPKSHIIPEFLYKELYDEKHRFFFTTSTNLKEGKKNLKPLQSGIYEGNILCINCDNSILGSLERYSANFLFPKNTSKEKSCQLIPNYIENGNQFLKRSNVDYNKFKLFFLSILWRSSISSKEFFKEIQIGIHEHIIREMIIQNQPGEINDYPVLITIIDQSSKSPKDYIGQPRLGKYEGHRIALFWTSSLLFCVIISSHKKPSKLLDMALKPSGDLLLPYLPKSQTWDLFLKFSGLNK